MARLKFGAFLAPHHPIGEHPMLQMREDIRLAKHLDELGYDEFWVGEHHSTGWEVIASPEMFLAAVGEHTQRIRLGTGVVSLPYHPPFNVAQRIVQLDHMTRGRVIFGTGPGALPSDAYMMGNEPNPAHPFAPVDALNYTGTTSELFTRGFTHFKVLDDLWEQTLGVGYSQTNRNYSNWDPSLPYDLSGDYQGTKIKGDWQNIFHLHPNNTLTLGLEDEEDQLQNQSENIGTKSYNTQGYYLSDQFKLFERSFTTASVRYSNNNRSGDKVTWSLTEAVLVKETGSKLKGNIGTGFKVPTLYELYAPFYGNPDLKPETSLNWDLGFEQGFFDQAVQFGATYFSNQFNNLIQADPANFWIAENINSATAKGVEAFVQVTPIDDLILRGNYTYDDTLDEDTGAPLINRPRNKGNFEANYHFLKDADINFMVIAVGEKDGVLGTRVPAYAIANLAGSYQVHPNVKLFARIDNLFNKEYQEVYGYGTTRLAGYGGVSLTY